VSSAPRSQAHLAVLGLVALLRPINLVLSVAGVFVGAYLAVGDELLNPSYFRVVLLAAVSAAAITAAANAINDAFDVKVDRVNRPDRPIPSGRITERAATVTWLAGALIGIAASLMISVENVMIAAASILLVYAYSAALKQVGFIGNFVVSAIVAVAIVYGAVATGTIGVSWAGALLAFALTLSREITKDLEDLEGDSHVGARTLPVVFGSGKTRAIAIGLVTVTILAAPLPYLFLAFDRLYLMGILVTDLFLLGAIWYLWSAAGHKAAYSRASLLLKSAMVAGLGSLVFA